MPGYWCLNKGWLHLYSHPRIDFIGDVSDSNCQQDLLDLKILSAITSVFAVLPTVSALKGCAGTIKSVDKLRDLAETWPTLAASKLSPGDATIKAVAERYAQSGYEVEMLTGDRGR